MAELVNPDFQLIFDSVDSDRSGRISAVELQQAMHRTGEKVTLEGCELLISLYDDNSSGSIDINGFAKLVQLHVTWKTIFQSFDKDKSGFIDTNELKDALKKIFKGKVNPINPNPSAAAAVKTKVKFEKTYIDTLITKFGSVPTVNNNPGSIFNPAVLPPTAILPSSKKGPRPGLNEEQFLLACAFVQKNPPMKESSKKKEHK